MGAIESDARLQGLYSRSAKRKAVVRGSSVSIEKESGHSGHIVGALCYAWTGRLWLGLACSPACLLTFLPAHLPVYIHNTAAHYYHDRIAR